MYYMLECWGPEGFDKTTIGQIPDFGELSWISGQKFSEDPVIPITVELEGGSDDVIVSMYTVGLLLLRDDVISALESVGVDNCDCYPAIINDPRSGRTLENYKAVNIVGTVAAANLDESAHKAHGSPVVDVDFDGLKIDEAKARNLKIFRLAECVTGIVIHESVRETLLEKGINDLDFINPEDWIG